MWAPFKKWAPLIWLSLLPKQLHKLENFSLKYLLLFNYYCSNVLQSFAQGLLNGTCIAKIVNRV